MRKETTVALVLIVSVMLALTYIVVARPFGGVSYITAQADKSSYTAGEPINFTLVSQTQFAHFRGDGSSYDYGVYISKIPEGLSLDDFLNHTSSAFSYIWPDLSHQPQVRFSQFNGDSAPLELIWDGTYSVRNRDTGEIDTFYPTSGYYFIYPKLFVSQGDFIQVNIDRGSVFYLNGLNVSTGLSFDHGTKEMTMSLSISDPDLEEGSYVLNSSMRYSDMLEEQPYSNQTLFGDFISYLNGTIQLDGGEAWNGTVSASVRDPHLNSVMIFGEVVVGEKRYGFGCYYAFTAEVEIWVPSSL